MQYTFPTDYRQETYLVPIDAALVPFISGALMKFQERGVWSTADDYEAGYNAFAELQAAMSGNGLKDLIIAVNQVYRLLDTSLNGTAYTSSPNEADPARPIIAPTIADTPPASTGAANAMRAHVGRIHQLAENAATGAAYPEGSGIDDAAELDYYGSWRARLEAVQGIINAGWFGIGGQPATLADLVNALRIGSEGDTTRITDAIDAIAGDSGLAQASQASNIFNTVKGLFEDVAGGVGEGAILGTLIASSLANAGMAGVLAGQIDRLIAALDGGGLVATVPAPAGSVLGELEAIKVQVQ
jgi:hypothetical protein